MSAAAAAARKPPASLSTPRKHYTLVPNAYFDRLPRCTTPSEYLCLGLIIRRTSGFQKDEAEISIEHFEKATGLKERIVYQALKGLESKKLIPSRGSKPGMKSSFRVNYQEFDKVAEMAPREVPKKKRDADGVAIPPAIVPANCPQCGPVQLGCPKCGGPVELLDEIEPAGVDAAEAATDQTVNDSTRPTLCRGGEEPTPAPTRRGDTPAKGERGGTPEPATPAMDCRGREQFETYLVGWIGTFCAPPPDGLVDEVAAILGSTELRWFTERCTIRSEWLQKQGWKGMYYMARDAVKAAAEWNATNVRRIDGDGSAVVMIHGIESAGRYTLAQARQKLQDRDLDPDLRAALIDTFPELSRGPV